MFEDIWHCLLVSGCIFCVFWCLEGCFIWYGWYFGMPELLGGVWDSLHEGFSLTGANSPIWPNPEKQDVLSPDSFEASKYQNLPICHFQKLLSFAIFLIFRICQREITIYSLFGSPCIYQNPRFLYAPPKYIYHHILQKRFGRVGQNWQVVRPTMDLSPPQTPISHPKKGLKGQPTIAEQTNK